MSAESFKRSNLLKSRIYQNTHKSLQNNKFHLPRWKAVPLFVGEILVLRQDEVSDAVTLYQPAPTSRRRTKDMHMREQN